MIYDENTAIQLGKLVNADYVLFLTITKLESGYSVNAKVTDLEEGIDIAITSPITRSAKDLIADTYGCAIDELTITLCEELDYSLSPTDKHIIMNGEMGLTESEKLEKFKRDEERYLSRLSLLDKEIKLLTESTEVDAKVKAKNLEAEKRINLERLKYSRAKQAKIEEDAKKKASDDIKNIERSEEQKIKLEATSKALQEKLSTVTVQNESFISKITYVEAVKKEFEDINNTMLTVEDQINQEAEEAIAIKKEEIEAVPLRPIEKSEDGHITYSAQANRDAQLKVFSDEIYEDINNATSEIEKVGETKKKQLVKVIEKGYETFKKVTLTTLGEELVVDIGEYDGNKYGWDLYITIQSDDVIVFQTESFLSYEDITHHKPAPDANDNNYMRYMDEVDYYESLFQRKEPVFTFAIDVLIKPLPNNRPSQYEFVFEDFRCYDTLKVNENGKFTAVFPIAKPHIRNSTKIHQMLPAYDIRTKTDLENEEKAKLKAEKKEIKKAEKKEEEKIERKMKARDQFLREEEEKNRDFKRGLVTLNFSFLPKQVKNNSLGIEYSKGIASYLYFNYKFDLFDIRDKNITYYPSSIDSKFNPMIANKLSLGANMHIGNKWQIYGGYGLGFNVSFPSSFFSDLTNTSDLDAYFKNKCKADFTHGFHIGGSFEILPHLVTTVTFSETYLFGKEYHYGSLDVGLGYMFHTQKGN